MTPHKINTKLKAWIFDADNVLMPTSEFTKMARDAAMNALQLEGLKVEKAIILEKLNKIVSEKGSNYHEHYNVLLDEFGVDKRKQSMLIAKAVIAQHHAKLLLQPYSDVPRTLLELRERGYSLYVATEGLPVKQWEKLYLTGLSIMFDKVFITEELSFKEKNATFFKAVLSEIPEKPEECVMVGDRVNKDLLPAKGNGIHTIRVLTGKYRNEYRDRKGKDYDYEIENFREVIDIIPLIEEKMK